jgi:hypothetical protein
MNSTLVPLEDLGPLLRGEVPALTRWTSTWNASHLARDIGLIVLGAGLFGAAAGCWRDPLQSLYAGIKLPLIILLTASGNALLNALLAPLLGLPLRFGQSFLAILASFALACAMLGAFSPLALFIIWNAPPLAEGLNNSTTHAAILLLLVSAIAFAGVAANLRLLQLLRSLAGNTLVAWRVLIAWLVGNLFLGSQLSWVLRPFIGSPGLPVQFLRDTAFDGNFYEAVFRSAVRFFN